MNKLKIGIIGAGRLGTVLARLLLKAGYPVQLSHGENSDTSERVAGLLGNTSMLTAKADIVNNDLILLAVRWEHVEEALVPLQHKLKGKILVDATNPFVNERLLFETAESICSSLVVSALVPGTIIVKAFNTLLADWLEKRPMETSAKRVVFISGDDAKSKKLIAGVIISLGFACIDLGNIRSGGLMQQGGGPLSYQNLLLLPGKENQKHYKMETPILKTLAVGKWVSIAVEVRPSQQKNPDGSLKPFYLTRQFTLRPDDSFDLRIINFADPYGKVPITELFISGHVSWPGPHPIAEGALKIDFSADADYLVKPLLQSFADLLNKTTTGFHEWRIGESRSIFKKAFLPFGLKEGDIFREFDLIYLSDGLMFWGARNIDGRGFGSDADRPTNLQIPMRPANA